MIFNWRVLNDAIDYDIYAYDNFKYCHACTVY